MYEAIEHWKAYQAKKNTKSIRLDLDNRYVNQLIIT